MHPNPHGHPAKPANLAQHVPDERLLRLPLVLQTTGRGRTATLDDVKAGRFPKPIKVGTASMWLHSEVQAWIAARVQATREGAP